MKIYVHEHGILMSGKAWEIKAKLTEMQNSFQTVEEWVDTVHSNATRTASATAKKKAGSSSYLRPIV